MKVWLRKAYLGVVWLIVAGIVIQFLLVGTAMFVGGGFGLHIQFGFFFMGVAPIVLLVLAWAAGLPRRAIGLSALMLLLMSVQVFLPGFRSMLPIVAALHPVNALLTLWFSLRLARQARAYAGESVMPVSVGKAPTQSREGAKAM
jgi:hypothetical protein